MSLKSHPFQCLKALDKYQRKFQKQHYTSRNKFVVFVVVLKLKSTRIFGTFKIICLSTSFTFTWIILKQNVLRSERVPVTSARVKAWLHFRGAIIRINILLFVLTKCVGIWKVRSVHIEQIFDKRQKLNRTPGFDVFAQLLHFRCSWCIFSILLSATKDSMG